ncbi:MAG: universal stress protein, partial [Calditrichales bacterium]
SARALQRFCHLADPDLVEITLLNASGNRGESMALLEKAQAYLNAHGIMDVHKEWADEDIVDLVASKYYKRMDAFVVGAHARQGLLDFMVGSLTKYLIRKAEKPVFIG